jgi:hypothetical protein
MTKYARHAQRLLTERGEADLSFPYNAGLVDEIKATIPSRYRSYNAVTKEWTVSPPYADLATTILLIYFPDADVPPRSHSWERRRKSRPASWPPDTDPFAVLHVLPSAPRAVIDAAYRALAKLHHPDRGGDPVAMRQLTEAHEALSRRLSG